MGFICEAMEWAKLALKKELSYYETYEMTIDEI